MAALFSLDTGWKLVIHDLGLEVQPLLKAAGLPLDMFQRDKPMVTAKQYFNLWKALENSVTQPDFCLVIATSISVEAFSPPLFAALCSDNLAMAMQRLQKYKKLIGPIQLSIDKQKDKWEFCFDSTSVEVLPDSYQLVECLFITNLLRIATRQQLSPMYVESPIADQFSPATKAFLNCEVRQAERAKLVFDKATLNHEFLSKNSQMWEFFEPQLNSNLQRFETKETTTEQVIALLLNLIPTGKAHAEEVASNLCVSKRTLQRKLADEGETFQNLLNTVRKKLAIHYLKKSQYANSEIAFLLGFDDPNSFIRAFSGWIGQSPESYRQSQNSN